MGLTVAVAVGLTVAVAVGLTVAVAVGAVVGVGHGHGVGGTVGATSGLSIFSRYVLVYALLGKEPFVAYLYKISIAIIY